MSTCNRCIDGWAYCVVNWNGNERHAVKPCSCVDGAPKRIDSKGVFRTSVQYTRESSPREFLCGYCNRIHVHGEADCKQPAPKDRIKLQQRIAKIEYVGVAPQDLAANDVQDDEVPV
jgi:hypothetical protein